MKDSVTRDGLRDEIGGILCFEMEAAGVMDELSCFVIREVSDYAGSHKNKDWQEYAAIIAAAYAKSVLGVVPQQETRIERLGKENRKLYEEGTIRICFCETSKC